MVFDKAGCYAPVSKLEKHQSIFNTLKPTKDDHIGAPQAEQRWMPVKATRLWGPSPTNTLMVPPPRSIEVVSRDLGHRQGGAWVPTSSAPRIWNRDGKHPISPLRRNDKYFRG